MTTPPAIEDLTKAELLRLVRSRLPFYAPADLVKAQWESACEEWKRLNQTARSLTEHVAKLAWAADRARGAARVKAQDAYAKAFKAEGDAYAKAEQAWKRSEALYAQMTALLNRR